MSEKIVPLNEEVIKGQIKELVRGSVKETIYGLLEAEAEKLTQAAKYERSEERQGYRFPNKYSCLECNVSICSEPGVALLLRVRLLLFEINDKIWTIIFKIVKNNGIWAWIR